MLLFALVRTVSVPWKSLVLALMSAKEAERTGVLMLIQREGQKIGLSKSHLLRTNKKGGFGLPFFIASR